MTVARDKDRSKKSQQKRKATRRGKKPKLTAKTAELDRVHGYLNSLPPEALVCPELPAAWRVTLARKRP